MLESKESVEKSESLRFLDPELFVGTNEWDLKRFLELYECAICNGVVLKPLECTTSTCSMLYCQQCVEALKDN